MKKEFSTNWKSSKQPRKQRKYKAKAPLHLKRKLMGVNLSKDLRKTHEKRTITVRKGDTVKIMKGKYVGKKGKIMSVSIKNSKVTVEGIQIKKLDGSKVEVKLQPSNLQIIELNLDDRKRKIKAKEKEKPKVKKEEIKPKKEEKK
jgi:large subunit ribosomal protein L24